MKIFNKISSLWRTDPPSCYRSTGSPSSFTYTLGMVYFSPHFRNGLFLARFRDGLFLAHFREGLFLEVVVTAWLVAVNMHGLRLNIVFLLVYYGRVARGVSCLKVD